MFTINKNVKKEITINKSKFITFIYKVENKNKIKEILKTIKNEFKDATHICFCYIIGNEKKANDDGEPKGTAALPMLNVLESKNLNNVLAVVVRYFGGIKLGASGLVRAYSSSVSKALEDVNIIPITKECKIRIEFDYKDVKNINYILKDYKITYKEFDQNIIYEFIYEENNYPKQIDNFIIKKEPIN